VAGQQEVAVKLLLEQGAMLESYYRTALSLAIEYGHETMVKLLLANGAQLESPSWYRFSPLTQAAARGHEAVVKLLLEKEADLGSYNDVVWMPLPWAAYYNQVGVVKLLLLESIKPLAAMDGYQQAVELLSASEESRKIPKVNYELVELQMLLGLKECRRSKRQLAGHKGQIHYGFSTALLCAAWMGFEAVAKLLLLVDGVNINFADFLNFTPLIQAAENGHVSLVQLLLENGAAPDITDSRGRTGLSWAEKNGHVAVVELLRSCSRSAPTSSDM
jgi:ankyrin repeat protein